jgi:hypothetical protein
MAAAGISGTPAMRTLARPIIMNVITTTGTTFHDPFEELLKQMTERVDAVVDQVAAESYQLDRPEEFTTSRLAQAISGAS